MKKENIIVLGRGFLGKEFERQGYKVFGRKEFGWPTIYLDNLDAYHTVINCIGVADTRYCEDANNWEAVYGVNSHMVGMLSSHCKRYHKRFVHISTACVYDKNNTPQKETSFLSSHCRYVVSKLAGEFRCNDRDLIIRPRLYFSDQADRNNLLTKLGKFDYHLNEVNSYTSTRTIVEAVTALINAKQRGVFNVAQQGYATMVQICKHLGIAEKPEMTGEQLQQTQGLALVNNIMDISKLQQFYQPRNVLDEFNTCWKNYNHGNEIR